MRKYILPLLCFLMLNCGSNFQSFYNNHKNDVGATSFQVPNFMKAVLGSISPEVSSVVGNLTDLKYIKLENVSEIKRTSLVEELNSVTNNGYKDMFRKNELTATRLISVKELGLVLTDVILFNSNEKQTTAFYLEGKFAPEKIKSLSDPEKFESITNQLLNTYQSNLNPSFNPNN
jgi:hypothetical protein